MKSISTWLFIASAGICAYNSLGFDDKNILLLLISPMYWVTGGFRRTPSIYLHYLVVISFWLITGIFLDVLLSKARRIFRGQHNKDAQMDLASE